MERTRWRKIIILGGADTRSFQNQENQTEQIDSYFLLDTQSGKQARFRAPFSFCRCRQYETPSVKLPKSLVAPALLVCLYSFLPASDAQTKPRTSQPPPYEDTDGYQALSSLIDAATEKLESGSVSIFYQTVSQEAFRGIREQCSSGVPIEFQSALEDFDKKGKTRFVLRRQFSIRSKYRFVETKVEVENGIYSMSAVGFDENKSHAIVLVQHLVRPAGSIFVGGSSILYLLRRTATGWQRAADIPQCGRIY